MIESTVETYATDGQCIQSWYCARTITGRESALNGALQSLRIETFLPIEILKRERQVLRRIPATNEYKHVPEPCELKRAFFPGYLFARLDSYGWAAVKTRLGV